MFALATNERHEHVMTQDRDDALYDRLAELKQAAAVAAERERQLEGKVTALEDEMKDIKELVAKGRGVLLVILSLGSMIGLLFGAWDKIAKFFGGHS